MFPILVDTRNKWLRFSKLLALIWFLYFLTNHIQIFPASTIKLMWLDKNIPFFAGSVWIYFSFFAIFIFNLLLESDEESLNRYFYGLLILYLLLDHL